MGIKAAQSLGNTEFFVSRKSILALSPYYCAVHQIAIKTLESLFLIFSRIMV